MLSAARLVPALLFFAVGCASAAQAVAHGISWRRNGFVREEGRLLGWAPLGDWQTAASLIGRLGRTPEEDEARKHEIRNRAAISARIVVFAIVAAGAYAGAYEFGRYGHGFGS